jgi:hypothetical protein
VPIARSSISIASYSALPTSSTRANNPGVKQAVLVRQHGAGADRAGLWIERIVHEVDISLVRSRLLVRKCHSHRIAWCRANSAFALECQLAIAQVGILVAFEVDIDRIDRDQRREEACRHCCRH